MSEPTVHSGLNGTAGGAAARAHSVGGGGGGGTICSLSPRQITNFILVEVINAKLTANGYRGLSHPFDPSSVQRTPPLSMLSDAALEMVRQFETRYIEKNQEDLSNYQINPDQFEEAYHMIIDGIFHRGINWGRVVALISLTSMMSLAAMRTGHEPEVANILDWTSAYITTSLWSWIQSNGGWDGLLKMTDQGDKTWESFKNFALCTVGALGLLGFGVFFGKR